MAASKKRVSYQKITQFFITKQKKKKSPTLNLKFRCRANQEHVIRNTISETNHSDYLYNLVFNCGVLSSVSIIAQESGINSNLIQTEPPNNFVSCQGSDACSNIHIDTENIHCSSKASCQNCNISYPLAGNTPTLSDEEDIIYQNTW